MTDCSFIFLYILCTMSIREVRERERGGVIRVGLCKTNAVNQGLIFVQNLQKLMGVGVSRSVSKLGNSLVGPSK